MRVECIPCRRTRRGNPAADSGHAVMGRAVAVPLKLDFPDPDAQDGRGNGVHSLMGHHVKVLHERPDTLCVDGQERRHSDGCGIGSWQWRLGNAHATDVKTLVTAWQSPKNWVFLWQSVALRYVTTTAVPLAVTISIEPFWPTVS